jgi:hypothetical protein
MRAALAGGLVLLFAWGCSHTSSKSKNAIAEGELAAQMREQEDFQRKFRAPAAEAVQEINGELELYMQMHFAAIAEMEKFDKQLTDYEKQWKKNGEAFDPLADASYGRLLAYRKAIEDRRRHIRHTYTKLTEIQMNQKSTPEDRIQARKIRMQMHRFVREKRNKPEILALIPVIQDMTWTRQEVIEEFKKTQSLSEVEANRRGDDILGMVPKTLQDTAATYSQVGSQVSWTAREALKNLAPEIVSELDRIQEEFAVAMRDRLNDRVPQWTPVFPSSERWGNLVGTELPRDAWVITYNCDEKTPYRSELFNEISKREMKASFFMAKNDSWTWAPLKMDPASPGQVVGRAVASVSGEGSNVIQYLRLPLGVGINDPRVRETLKQQKAVHVAWNADGLDWLDYNPKSVSDRLQKQMRIHGRGIVLMHGEFTHSLQATKMMFDYMKKEKLSTVTLDDVVNNR